MLKKKKAGKKIQICVLIYNFHYIISNTNCIKGKLTKLRIMLLTKHFFHKKLNNIIVWHHNAMTFDFFRNNKRGILVSDPCQNFELIDFFSDSIPKVRFEVNQNSEN